MHALDRGTAAAQPVQGRFFVAMSMALLGIVFLGFAPTFFLSTFFEGGELPFYLHVHGVVLTAWYSWLVLQTSLVAFGRVDLHRRLGIVGAVLGVAVIAVTTLTLLRFPPRMAEVGYELDAEQLAEIVWIDTGLLFSFASFLTMGILSRRRPQSHKRFMILAAISIVTPAALRVIGWPVWEISGDRYVPLLFTLAALLVALGLYDLRWWRRVHPATLVGGGVIMLVIVLGGYVLPKTTFGVSAVSALYELVG